MTEEQRIALVRARSTAAMLEAAGMLFANLHCAMTEKPLKYGEGHFVALIDKHHLSEADVRDTLERE